MTFILIFGPPAVGKMSVGQALEAKTGFPLFHNHATIEVVRPFFDFGTPAFNRLVTLYRMEMFKEVAQSDLEGMIFTFTWAIGLDEDYVDDIVAIFKAVNAKIIYVELEATLEERLRRNKTPNRLQHKASKRDVEHSEKVMMNEIKMYQMNTKAGAFNRPNYLKIDNTHLLTDEVADKIIQYFNL